MIFRNRNGTLTLTDDVTPTRTTTLAASVTGAALQTAIDAFFNAAPLPVPDGVSMYGFRRAVIEAGRAAAALAAINASDATTQAYWQFQRTVGRQDPELIALATALGATAASVDDIFRKAAGY